MLITQVANGRIVENVGDDESCFGLYEGPFKTPDQTAWHRYQVVYVRREVPDGIEEELHAHVTDMGLNILFPYPALRLVADGDEDTVGHMRYLAEQIRADHRPQLPDVDPRKWAEDSVDRLEQRFKRLKRQTQFGPGSTTSLEQRNF